MGSTWLAGMMEETGKGDVTLRLHLQHNVFPPRTIMFDCAKQAIDACYQEESDRHIELPDGVTWRDGSNAAPAYAIMDHLHLWAFIGE